MTTFNIDLPEPVLTIGTVYDIDAIGTGEIVAQIKAGDVVVFEKAYSAEWEAYTTQPENYVQDDDEAKSRVIEEFGEKLKALFSAGEEKK